MISSSLNDQAFLVAVKRMASESEKQTKIAIHRARHEDTVAMSVPRAASLHNFYCGQKECPVCGVR